MDEDADGQRIDACLAEHAPLSRTQVAKLIEAEGVRSNGRAVRRASSKVRAGDVIECTLPAPEAIETEAQDLPITIVHEDEDLIVIDKASGMVVHPAPGHPDGTLVNALLHHVDDLSGIGGAIRPGIVHRIDRDTSGLLVVAKSDRAHQHLQALFQTHDIEREYLGIAVRTGGEGLQASGTFRTGHARHPRDRKRFTGSRGGARQAVTHYRVEEEFGDGAMLVACTLETGRTHQIRMHLAEAGAPLLGDPLYGGRAVAGTPLIGRVALHAHVLGFRAPSGEALHFRSPPPDDFQRALDALRRGASWRR